MTDRGPYESQEGLYRWRWVNNTGRPVSVRVAGVIVCHTNDGNRCVFDAEPRDRFEVFERYGAEIGGGYAMSEIPFILSTVVQECERI